MRQPFILASASEIRATLLRNAGLNVEVSPARIDEDAIKLALQAEDAPPRDIADTLAEMKARKVSLGRPDALVIGCDQVLQIDKECLSKPSSPEDAVAQLRRLRGPWHCLIATKKLTSELTP